MRRAARTGYRLDAAPGIADIDLDAGQGGVWLSHRRLPAELVRLVLLDPNLQPDPRGLKLRGFTLTGVLDLEATALPCPLHLQSCTLRQPPLLLNATVPAFGMSGCYSPGLRLDGARIGADLALCGLISTGEVCAVGAHIGGHLDLQGATLTNPDGCALDLADVQITGGADLEQLTATGEVRAVGTHIGGALNLQGATLTNPGGDALVLYNTRIDGGADLEQLTATGEVRAIGTHIGGAFDLEGATLTNPGRNALTLHNTRIHSGAFLNRLNATGEVRAIGAQIGGQLNLQGATLTNPGGDALVLSNARVKGGAFLKRLTATGQVRLDSAHIGADLDLQDASLANPNGHALLGQRLRVARLFLDDSLSVEGSVDLTGAQITDLSTGVHAPGPLIATGWQVLDLHGGLRTSPKAAARWLASAPQFTAQPWHELAQVYDRNGQTRDARYLRVSAARLQTAHAPWWAKPPRWAYGLLVGYGYIPLLAAAWLLAALFGAWLITSTHQSSFSPSNLASLGSGLTASTSNFQKTPPDFSTANEKPLTAATVTGATTCQQLRGNYSCFRPLLYSLDVVLPPTVATGQSTAWAPTRAWIAYTLTTLRTFGWLLTALLIAGVTGLLRKT